MSFHIPTSATHLYFRSEILKMILRNTRGMMEVLNLYVILCILSSVSWRMRSLAQKGLWIAAIVGKINRSPIHQTSSGRRILVLPVVFHVESFSHIWNRLLWSSWTFPCICCRYHLWDSGFCLGNSYYFFILLECHGGMDTLFFTGRSF